MRKGFLLAALRSVSCLFALVLLSVASLAGAAPLPSYVTIVEDLPLYETPSLHASTEGVVGPQTMQVLETKEAGGRKWLSVNTWLGPKWIQPSFDYQGSVMRKESFDLQLYEDAVLYDYPSEPSKTRYHISPQKVHADAVAYVYNPGEPMNWQYRAVRIDTWLGKKWIIPDRYLPYVQTTDETVTLNTYTLLFGGVTAALDSGPGGMFNHTLTYLPTLGMIAPQPVQAFEKVTIRYFNTTWYHVHTASGDAAWVNPQLHMPAEIVPENNTYELTRTTSIHTYPFDSASAIGAAAPQQIESFERAGDWIHAHTWMGDGWLRIKDERKLDMTDSGHRVQVGVTPNPFPSYESGGPMHVALEGTLAAIDTPYSRSDIELRLEIYNDKGEAQEISKTLYNVRAGESRYFFIMVSANFNFRGAQVRLKSVSFKPAEDRSQDVYALISRFD
ncbi:hypothetical protein O9H85_28405 [Paenibacillus filicis]|uniref:Copper amine oxidase N-terminal domain-containing protein n=1 Tax=Paenibacillus gyeongsangnamensis TaxID=3388067 RepID=A0ABT4QHH7_9BACL|nr:hypothetical protein [Paenibacillus filicis]MCZ8516247.1 hypothetical protein [Paenibacillus filicis]